MYATRRLSDLQKNPELLAASPDGPNSGYLIIQDEESKKAQSCLSWSNKSRFHKKLPFPQDKEVIIKYTNKNNTLLSQPVFFIPVLNRPLSHDCYYAIVPSWDYKGKAFTGSRVEDIVTTTTTCCCFFNCPDGHDVVDVSPTPLDPKNLYQQFHIFGETSDYTFQATTLALDGIAPYPLRQPVLKDWHISFKNPSNNLKLDATAQGLDHTLRARLPEFKFPLSQKPFVVGKWYSPFTFFKEGTVREQVTRSMYYEVTLEQRWERIVRCTNDDDKKSNGAPMNNVVFESEEVFVGGRKAWLDEKSESAVFWYASDGGGTGKTKTRVGLRKEIVERMRWEQERGGWLEECVKGGDWSEFGSYVLVERFNFRRMDGSLVMSFDFKHFNHLRTNWDSE